MLCARNWIGDYNAEKHQIRYELQDCTLFLRLPLQVVYPINPLTQSLQVLNYVLVMVESGLAATGYFEDSETVHHKVFRAYMVRKKQGKSQLKHLKTKGKSRAGSRVRLAESLQFFSEINEQLTAYLANNRVDKIAVSLSKTLLPYFFGAKVPPPFDKSDPRIYEIPKHIPDCNYENLMQAHWFLRKGELKYPSALSSTVDQLLTQLRPMEDDNELDDW
nr:hypothetical protein [Lunatimonas salinarum]